MSGPRTKGSERRPRNLQDSTREGVLSPKKDRGMRHPVEIRTSPKIKIIMKKNKVKKI